MTESWLVWLLVGIALLVAEIFTLGFLAAFFGLSAIFVGTLTFFGIIEALSIQLGTFVVLSITLIWLLRKHCSVWFKGFNSGSETLNTSGLTGLSAVVQTEFCNGHGTVKLNGTKWDAVSDESLQVNDQVVITGQKGISLIVRKS